MPTETQTAARAIDWLNSFANSEQKLPRSPAEFNLPRSAALLDLLGQPQLAFPSVVIAGTKGKGSTAAMLEAMLRAAGLRSGLYTSPHLHSLRERVQVDRQPIAPDALAAQVDRLRPVVARLDPSLGPLSTYEVTTALALCHFAAAHVGCAVLEIGLGGRYDAVNTVVPLVSAIASISYDHTESLGTTLDAIAYQKAGIIKPGVPAVTVPQEPAAAATVAAVAAEVGAPLYIAEQAGLRDTDSGLLPYLAPLRADRLGLPGLFQLENARLASGVALLLRAAGMPLDSAAAARGLATVSWPGRLETLRTGPWVVADGAHNGDSAHKLMAALRALFVYDQLILILGTSADKDIAAIAGALVPEARAVILTRTPHSRSASFEELLAAVGPLARGRLLSAPDVAAALDQALQLAGPADLICATGSLFVAAAAREALGATSL